MRAHLPIAAILTLVLDGCGATRPASNPTPRHETNSNILPLVRLRLYASGVGYFERQGDLRVGTQTLPVPTGHLDDALKSLVLIGPEQADVTVSFPSRLSPAVARARAGLPAAESAALSYDRLLAALRGEEVEIVLNPASKGRAFRGRVVEVVAVKPSHPSYDHGPVDRSIAKDQRDPAEAERLHLVLLTLQNELMRFDVTDISSVRPIDPSIAGRFEVAMSARIASRANPTQWLSLAGNAAAQNIHLGYLAETPTWRASYRLLLGEHSKRAELQAWALIHNDTEETWHNVKLELVDGNPSSFLYPLAAPRYQRRELSAPESELSSVPQLSTTTPDSMWGDFSDYQGEVVESLGSVETSGSGSGSGEGYGSGHGRLGGSHKTRAPRVATHSGASDLLWVGDLVKTAGIVPSTERTISIYPTSSPVTLPPQHSAMLSFLKQSIAAESIVWFSTPQSKPERAIGISNNTSNNFPAGPMAVFARGGFLGEALLTNLQPGARQFARIGQEPDIDLTATEIKRDQVRKHMDFRGGVLAVHSIVATTTRLLFNNRTGGTAEAYVGQEIVTNATIQGSSRIDFDSTTGTPFAVFDVTTGQGKEETLTIRQGLMQGWDARNLSADDLEPLLKDANLPSEERLVLSRAKVPLLARTTLQQKLQELDAELEARNAELARLRTDTESLKNKDAAGANPGLFQRLLQRHDEVTRLEAKKRMLEKDIEAQTTMLCGVLSDFDATRAALRQEFERMQQAGSGAAQEARNH